MSKRTESVITAEIAKLQAELKDVQTVEHRKNSAVHILHNLGWSYDSKRMCWLRPTTAPLFKEFDPSSHNPFKVGDWVEGKISGRQYRVESVSGNKIWIQQFSHRDGIRLLCLPGKHCDNASVFRSIPSSALLSTRK